MPNHITRAVTQDEIAAYKQAGVVLLKAFSASHRKQPQTVDHHVVNTLDDVRRRDFAKIPRRRRRNDISTGFARA